MLFRSDVIMPFSMDGMDIDQIRGVLLSSLLPYLQAFYSLGVDQTQEMLSRYFPQFTDSFREVIDGKASVIINRGKINFEEMLKQRYNLDDLLTQLRAKSIKSIEEVDYAILETSGKLSIFKSSDDKNHTYPLPVIIDGKIIMENREMKTLDVEKIMFNVDKIAKDLINR